MMLIKPLLDELSLADYGKHTSRQETFFVFHQNGYNAYNPRGCYTKRQVHSSFGHLKYIPEELDGPIYLCDQQKDCLWGQSVNVRNKFLYIAQPNEHRVVVIDSSESMNPVEVRVCNVYIGSTMVWDLNLFISNEFCVFSSLKHDMGIENTQRVGCKSYQITNHGRLFLSHVCHPTYLLFIQTMKFHNFIL
jgi:hypothetical protein